MPALPCLERELALGHRPVDLAARQRHVALDVRGVERVLDVHVRDEPAALGPQGGTTV